VSHFSEKKLIQDLTQRYAKVGTYGRPLDNSSQPLTVDAGVHLIHILDLDEHNQVITTSISLEFVSLTASISPLVSNTPYTSIELHFVTEMERRLHAVEPGGSRKFGNVQYASQIGLGS
jgi:hypothetical protein